MVQTSELPTPRVSSRQCCSDQKVSDDDFQNITYLRYSYARDYTFRRWMATWLPRSIDSTQYQSAMVLNLLSWYWCSSTTQAIATVGLDQYANMLKDADAELLDHKNAMKYAAVLGWQIARLRFQFSPQMVVLQCAQRTVPYSRASSWVGTSDQEHSTNTLKWLKMLSPTKDFNKAKKNG